MNITPKNEKRAKMPTSNRLIHHEITQETVRTFILESIANSLFDGRPSPRDMEKLRTALGKSRVTKNMTDLLRRMFPDHVPEPEISYTPPKTRMLDGCS